MKLINYSNVITKHKSFIKKNEIMVQTLLDRTKTFAEDHVQKYPKFKRRTGNLQDSTEGNVIRTSKGHLLRLKNNAKYASYIEYGTNPHLIFPKKKRFLKFNIKGKTIFARFVKHPGTKPYKFMYNAWNASNRIVKEDLIQQTMKIAKEF